MKKNINIGPTDHSPCVEPVAPSRITPDDLPHGGETSQDKPAPDHFPPQQTDRNKVIDSDEKKAPIKKDKSDNNTPPAQL